MKLGFFLYHPRKTKSIWSKLGMAALIVLMGTILILSQKENVMDAFNPVTGRMILIDAGHGGVDAGVIGPVTQAREDDLNLAVARKIRAYFEESGAHVMMTRDKKEGLYDDKGTWGQRKSQDMERRGEMIRNSKADIMVSIHMNKFPQSQYYGAQTFYQRGSSEGKKLAERVQKHLVKTLDPGNKREAKASDYFVLRSAASPSIIIECGFMSNPQEEQLLVDPKYQEKIAWSIYTGVMSYFSDQK